MFFFVSLCLPAVPQHAVCSSEFHHGEGGEHPAVQPVAPTHPHLTPDRTRPEQTRDPGPGAEPPASQTETAELEPRRRSVSGLTRLRAQNIQFKPIRGLWRRSQGKKKKGKTQRNPQLVLTLFDRFGFFGGFQSFKAVFFVVRKEVTNCHH